MIITSFSEAGYQEYGKRFIYGFLSHWHDEDLTVYTEGEKTTEEIRINYPMIRVDNLLDMKGFVRFSELLAKSDPLYSGKMRNPNTGEAMYNFRYDANKFFRKVYAITEYDSNRRNYANQQKDQGIKTITQGPMAWLDADIIFHRKIPPNFLTDILAGHAMAILGRTNMYPETGFIAWDPDAKTHDQFMSLYLDIYLNGAFRLLTEWHDCQVLEFARIALDVDTRNIAKGCDPNHPFVYSTLGTYMDHLKGPERKEMGRSPEGQPHAA